MAEIPGQADSSIPQWITLKEASFLTGETVTSLRRKVMAGQIASNAPFGPWDEFLLVRTLDLFRSEPRSVGATDPTPRRASSLDQAWGAGAGAGQRVLPRLARLSPATKAAVIVFAVLIATTQVPAVRQVASDVLFSSAASSNRAKPPHPCKGSGNPKQCLATSPSPWPTASPNTSPTASPNTWPTASPNTSPSASPSPSPNPSPSPSASPIPSPSSSPSPDPSPTPAPSGVGPQQGIACPTGAVAISPGQSIQSAVNANPAGTAFCLRPGVHTVGSSITPKSGTSFTGEYGAIIEGSAILQTADRSQAIFRARNQDIDDVTIQNLVLRNGPGGVSAYRDHSDRWTLSHNEIVGTQLGVQHGNSFWIHHNYIHDNWQYGIGGYRSTGSIIEHNEFAFNAARRSEFPGDSATSKWAQVTNTTIRGNLVHDNHWSGIWFDGGHNGILIEGNIVRNNQGNGIFTEIGGRTVIRNNVVAGSHRGVYISESHDTEVYGNSFESTDRAVALFQDGNRLTESELHNNLIRDNTIRVPVTGILASPMAVSLNCTNLTSTQCASYSTSRGNEFRGNEYFVHSAATRNWYWKNASKMWTEWQAEGQDQAGTLHIL